MATRKPVKSPLSPIRSIFSPIEVLVVLDGRATAVHTASFGPGPSNDSYFGLSEFIRALTGSNPHFPGFHVTKAHRDTDPGHAADLEHFRFSTNNLSVYDEIWLFGVATPGESDNAMDDVELSALATFMDGGGGVFATGDHEDLGVVLNGKVPRVRSMRKWYYPSPGPNGEPVAPPALGTDRIETTQRRPGDSVTYFDDQSDDIPQPITPRFYAWSGTALAGFFYPHPVLCGLRGPIGVLPDHMHEGEVIEPWDTSATLTFAGKSFVEYPVDASGNQEAPQIIAWGKVLAETNVSTEGVHTGDPNNTATPRSFGVVGAYDGHRVGVGRVVVDSTWHHFFDINLIGDPAAPFPKTQGFNATPAGQQALADIETYYRNIASWIARPGIHLFPIFVWYALRAQPLAMLVNPARNYTYPEMLHIGRLGVEAVLRLWPPCTFYHWVFKQFVDGPVPVIPPDPWAQPQPGDPPFIDPAVLSQAAMGGAVIALAREREALQRMTPAKASDAITRLTREGVRNGMRELGRDIGRYGEGLQKLAKAWTAE
jgi:hypothetical protein